MIPTNVGPNGLALRALLAVAPPPAPTQAQMLALVSGGRHARAPTAMTEAAVGVLPRGYARDPNMWRQRAIEVMGEGCLVGKTADLDITRLLALPVLPEAGGRCPDPDGYAAGLRHHAAPDDFAFRPLQLDALWEFETLGGLISPLGVGGGKSLITAGCAKVGIQRRGHRRVILLVPPEVVDQFTRRDMPLLRRWLALDGIPFWHVKGPAPARMKLCQQPGPGVWIYTYSLISQPSGEDELRAISPTLWICDEAHNVARRTSARTKRLIHTFEEVSKAVRSGKLAPDVTAVDAELIALSGTLTRRSLKDYCHLSNMALVNASPIPFYGETIREVSLAIDADFEAAGLTDEERARVSRYLHWAASQGLKWGDPKYANHTWQDYVREAYKLRLRSAPGVVGSNDTGVEASLIISWSEPARPKGADGELMVTLMKQIAEEMRTPDGDEIDFGMHSFKWFWELSSGFYNSLRWPNEDEVMRAAANKQRPVDRVTASGLIAQAKIHHEFKQKYHVALRQFLKKHRYRGCDSPMLVANELIRQAAGEEVKHPLPGDLKKAYAKMKEQHYDDLPDRRRLATRVCDYKAAGAARWGKEMGEGLMWFHHPEVGAWVSELLTEEGIKHTFAPAGQNEAVYTPGLVVSSFAHGTGKNLQHQSRNLIIELPDSAQTFEQVIGRTHRSGQKADDVRCDVFVSNGFDMALFNHLLRDADYIQASTGTVQRLCYATYSPLVPPVNSRLIERLGIVREGDIMPDRRTVEVYESLTPPEALDWSSVFRSALYAAGTEKS